MIYNTLYGKLLGVSIHSKYHWNYQHIYWVKVFWAIQVCSIVRRHFDTFCNEEHTSFSYCWSSNVPYLRQIFKYRFMC